MSKTLRCWECQRCPKVRLDQWIWYEAILDRWASWQKICNPIGAATITQPLVEMHTSQATNLYGPPEGTTCLYMLYDPVASCRIQSWQISSEGVVSKCHSSVLRFQGEPQLHKPPRLHLHLAMHKAAALFRVLFHLHDSPFFGRHKHPQIQLIVAHQRNPQTSRLHSCCNPHRYVWFEDTPKNQHLRFNLQLNTPLAKSSKLLGSSTNTRRNPTLWSLWI